MLVPQAMTALIPAPLFLYDGSGARKGRSRLPCLSRSAREGRQTSGIVPCLMRRGLPLGSCRPRPRRAPRAPNPDPDPDLGPDPARRPTGDGSVGNRSDPPPSVLSLSGGWRSGLGAPPSGPRAARGVWLANICNANLFRLSHGFFFHVRASTRNDEHESRSFFFGLLPSMSPSLLSPSPPPPPPLPLSPSLPSSLPSAFSYRFSLRFAWPRPRPTYLRQVPLCPIISQS